MLILTEIDPFAKERRHAKVDSFYHLFILYIRKVVFPIFFHILDSFGIYLIVE